MINNRHLFQTRPFHTVAMVFSLLMLSACASTPPVDESAGTAAEPALPSEPANPALKPLGSAAKGETDDKRVASLWMAAEEARNAGRNAAALELLYGGLDLDPNNALFWSRAAELQLSNLEAALAESHATKSNAFADETDRTLLYRNWLIIEHARKMRGDLLGVRSAHKKVQQYQYQ